MAGLRAIKGPDSGKRYALPAERMVLGRHPDCDIVVDFGAVSRQHAQILRVGENYFVEDLRSRNGTFVNDQLIEGRRQLNHGDRLRICDLTFSFFDRENGSGPDGSALTGDSSMSVMLEDLVASNSTIMSKLEVSTGSSHVRIEANPQAKLRAVLEINQSLSKALAMEDVLPKVLDSLFKIFLQADRGFIVLRMPEGTLVPKAIKFRREGTNDTIRISRTVVEEVMTKNEAILSADTASDSRFQMAQSIADFRIRSMMVAPLIDSEGTALGIIQIDTQDQRNRFHEEDLEVLAGVAAQAGLAIENAQLHESALEQESMKRDLEMAHRVQQGLLPATSPTLDGYFFFDFYDAAKEVGGDFYDYVHLPGGRMAVVLADVSGKGVSAALLMARVSSEARFSLAIETDVAEAVNRLNASFCNSGWEDRFVTMVLMVVDPQREEVTIVNAGHMPPLVRHRDGTAESMPDDFGGLPLGVDVDHRYAKHTRRMEVGDCLAVFTDGFSEAMNAGNELYGTERLQARMGDALPDVTQLGRHILTDVKTFVGGRSQSDDMCLVIVGRES